MSTISAAFALKEVTGGSIAMNLPPAAASAQHPSFQGFSPVASSPRSPTQSASPSRPPIQSASPSRPPMHPSYEAPPAAFTQQPPANFDTNAPMQQTSMPQQPSQAIGQPPMQQYNMPPADSIPPPMQQQPAQPMGQPPMQQYNIPPTDSIPPLPVQPGSPHRPASFPDVSPNPILQPPSGEKSQQPQPPSASDQKGDAPKQTPPEEEYEPSDSALTHMVITLFSLLFSMIWFSVKIPFRIGSMIFTFWVLTVTLRVLWLFLADDNGAWEMGAGVEYEYNMPGIY